MNLNGQRTAERMNPDADSRTKKGRKTGNKEKIITYSQNIFTPVTNLCRNKCAYCGFRREPEEGAWVMSSEEIMELCEEGKRKGATEALITLGEMPENYELMNKKLSEWGYSSTADYLEELSKKILKTGLLPHINPGIVEKKDLERLRKWSASMGLMLECTSEINAHDESPGKKPELRLEMLEIGGKLKIPFTTGILVGIGETWGDRVNSLRKIRGLQKNYGHIQEVIIQPFVPKKGTPMENRSPPKHTEVLKTVSMAKDILKDTKIQIPPNLVDNIADYISVGANDLGGISTLTPDYVNPGKAWPETDDLKREVSKMGYRLRERLPIQPKFTKDPEFMSKRVQRVVDALSDEPGYRRV